ncbi:hypothetical protein L6164_018044 [Bauhinia variegata]|uniref:Uncharacterized protein n=1 Tax=Bauhinia variegata TaxID=167791 RepID=A0ACB9N9R2_BAUVA|nr:hypothetical protein L6164_018044 [Bauhinia variegata]
MASLPSVHLSQLNLGFRSRAEIPTIDVVKVSPGASPASSKPRFRGIPSLQIKRRSLIVSATDSNSKGEKPSINGTNDKETSNTGQGPPLLTILAGLFVLFLFGWILWFIVSWLIGLIFNLSPPK